MARTNFEKLRVYQLSEEMADEIWRMVLDWNILAQDTVGKQMIRAADSIPANIAEGSGKGTQKELISYSRIARGSLYETQNWLRRAYLRKLMTSAQVEHFKRVLDELAPTLNAYLRAISKPRPDSKDQKPKT